MLGNIIDVARAVGQQPSGPVLVPAEFPWQLVRYWRLPFARKEVAFLFRRADSSLTDRRPGQYHLDGRIDLLHGFDNAIVFLPVLVQGHAAELPGAVHLVANTPK